MTIIVTHLLHHCHTHDYHNHSCINANYSYTQDSYNHRSGNHIYDFTDIPKTIRLYK